MAKNLIIMNLLFALVLLPVAQAFANPFDIASSTGNKQVDMSHCKHMNNGNCAQNIDCDASGMPCVDAVNLAVLVDHELAFEQIKGASLSNVRVDYFYLSHRDILRPPRNS